MKKYIIYGAGKYLEDYLPDIKDFYKNILMIVDGSDDKIGKNLNGFEIKSKEELKNVSDDVTIAIASKKFYNSIINDIKKINPNLQCIPLYEALLSVYPVTGYCNICETNVAVWRTIGKDNKTAFKIIGNGLRKGGCPACMSYDRHRWQYYVINNYTDLIKKDHTVLHFAPEYRLFTNKLNYFTADIVKGRADYVVDITDIGFEDKTFDYIIANHVLEHIPDEKKAISELIRCLKDDGTIILSFPYSLDTNTLEDKNIVSIEDREKYYGQHDHVRLYGQDYKERLENYGLRVSVYKPVELLDKANIEKHRFIEEDIVILCKKR